MPPGPAALPPVPAFVTGSEGLPVPRTGTCRIPLTLSSARLKPSFTTEGISPLVRARQGGGL
jgi:hypothetical protein